MYTVDDYGDMIADRVRMKAYAQALRAAVKPGAVVLDIGTGSGILALLACRNGARRVYAIEPDAVIEVARQIAQANGFSDRIVFFQDLSTRVNLPEPADVIVSDLRGTLPLANHHIQVIVDARRRHLAANGTLIPHSDTLWASLVGAPQLYRKLTAAWSRDGYDLDMQAGRNVVTNTPSKVRLKARQLLGEPQRWATLDYASIEATNVAAQLSWTARGAATAHGVCAWFDATLAEGVEFSNSPHGPKVIYGQLFFPWGQPVRLAAGDVITVELEADQVGEDYIWRWETYVRGRAGGGRPKIHFEQSTFFGAPLSIAQLHKRAATHVPALNLEGEIDRFILAQMDGQTPQEELTRRLVEHYAARFPRWEDALTRVGELSQKYSR